MRMTGEQQIAAPRQKVWEALNDPQVLAACIPGCQSLEKEGDDRFAAIAEVKKMGLEPANIPHHKPRSVRT